MPEGRLCKDCKHSVPANEYGLHCRRYPPTVIGHVALDGSGNTYWDNVHPLVAADHWCGEWSQK